MVDIAAGAGTTSQSEFRIGQALSKAISVYGRHIVLFTLIAGVIGIPTVWSGYYLATMQRSPQTVASTAALAPLIGIMLSFFLQPLSTAIILYGAFQDMRGLPVTLGECLARGLSRFPSLLGLMVVTVLGMMVAALLLVVPALILMVMWYVSVPACVVEKAGPIGSLGRSRMLTKGHRWKLFGLLILVALAGILGRVVFATVGTLAGGPIGALAAQTVWQGVAQAFGSVLIVVAYHDLRVAKEGVDIERIASVFD